MTIVLPAGVGCVPTLQMGMSCWLGYCAAVALLVQAMPTVRSAVWQSVSTRFGVHVLHTLIAVGHVAPHAVGTALTHAWSHRVVQQ